MKRKGPGKVTGQRRSAKRARAAKPARRGGRSPVPARSSSAAVRANIAARASEAKSAAAPRLAVRMIGEPVPYAEVSIREPVVEASMERLFEHARVELLRRKPRRILVDMHDAEVRLSISDLNGLAKLVAGSFMGLVERLAIVLRPEDLPPEKFFEPSMIHRGLPTYVAVDRADAIDWLTAKHWR